MKMWVYIIRRAVLLVPVVIGVMTITFLLVSAIPIQQKLLAELGPSKIGYAPYVSCGTVGINQPGMCRNPSYWNGIHQLGLDQPIPVQWGRYIFNSLTLNWGTTDPHSEASTFYSLTSRTPVTTVLSWYLPYTLELAALSLFFILLLAIPLGNRSAVYRNRPVDQATRVMSFSGFALPGFLLATLVLLGMTIVTASIAPTCNTQATPLDFWYGSWPPASCFSGGVYPSWISPYLHTSPTGFPTVDALVHGQWGLAFDTLRRLFLPALVIAYGSVAGILRFVRNSMLEVMNLDFVRTARSKCVPEAQVVGRHAGRNSLNVTVTVLGLTFAAFVGGFPVIEDVFHLRGIGLVLTYSIQPAPDLGLIFGSTLLFTILVVLANIIVDILYAYLDPRVRLG
jgi:ABC-type dipeptide/oligopeptide/nickel transport system permease component